MHTLTSLALTAPVLVFYFVIASEIFGEPREHYMVIAPTALAQVCSAFAKDPNNIPLK